VLLVYTFQVYKLRIETRSVHEFFVLFPRNFCADLALWGDQKAHLEGVAMFVTDEPLE